MFKKAFQIIVTFILLVGAYRGYVAGFAAVSSRLVKGRVRTEVAVFVQHESKTAKEATRFAVETFGAGHWAADKELKWRVYDADRGFYLYYQNYERLEGGKRIKLWPFAIIWKAKGGVGRKSALSKEAIVDLSEPLGILKPNSAALHVTHAQLLGDVRMRDDKGTLADPTDDLFVGPLNGIEYDEAASRIYTDSDMEIRDRDLVAYTRGLNIDLRKSNGPGAMGGPGFEAKTATLLSKVHIVAKNVGQSGILPGAAKTAKSGRPTPLDARCDAELRIDFPPKVPPLRPWVVGPPKLEEPTIATLHRNVVVVRGDVDPDQLNSDTLRLTLVPLEKPNAKKDPAKSAPTAAPTTAPGSEGPLTELTLVEANALGHAVWLQSKGQGVVARCNELIYNKFENAPDETYLRADNGKQIFVEKIDPVDPAKPTSGRPVTTIFAFDAKIFDDRGESPVSTVVARGPGRYESRPGRDKAVERSADWRDDLILRTDVASDGKTRRRLTLNGFPKLVDHTKEMTLEAKRSVVVSLRPKAGAATDAKNGSDASQIEWMQAREDVVLKSPGKHMTARDQLDATFDDDQNPVASSRPAPPANGFANPFGPVVATKPGDPKPTGEPAKSAPDAKKAPAPLVAVKAHRVWTKIRQKADGSAPEILEALLRGGVSFHQDAAPGKPRGLDVTGEAVDVVNQGDGLMKFKNYWLDPSAQGPSARLAANGKPEPPALARIVTEDRFIEGQVIGLDQKADYAWAKGPGKIIQLVEPGMLNEKGFDQAAADKPKDPRPKVPFTITWNEDMRFTGQSKDPKGRDSAKAEFRGEVKAWMEDAVIYAQELDTYTDRPIKLDKAVNPLKPDAAAKPDVADLDKKTEGGDDKPQLALLDARGPNVVVIYVRRDPKTNAVVDKQRMQGRHIVYDKTTGEFEQDGPGLVHLWRHRALDKKQQAEVAARPPVRPVAGRDEDQARALLQAEAEAKLGPWELTQIKFTDKMNGRFGLGKDRDQSEPRTADFYGAVQTLVGPVKNADSGHDFDRPPAGFKSLTADALRVVEFPPPGDAPKGTPAVHTLTAEGNGNARDETHTIAGDLITFDSAKELFHVYGKQGREVVILDQKNPGLAFSNARGEAARYNHKTGAAELINPSSVILLDGEGARAKTAAPPGPAGPPPKPIRTRLRPPPLGHMERKSFSGR